MIPVDMTYKRFRQHCYSQSRSIGMGKRSRQILLNGRTIADAYLGFIVWLVCQARRNTNSCAIPLQATGS